MIQQSLGSAQKLQVKTIFEQVPDDAGYFMSHGFDGLGSSQPGFSTAGCPNRIPLDACVSP
jgi:hypothetical protein